MPLRHTFTLQNHRRSRAESRCFLTCCTKDRRPTLVDSSAMSALIDPARQSDGAKETLTYAFTVMPDHLHWVLRLGSRLTLGQVVAKIKSLARSSLSSRQLEWQRNYYEHELRADELPEDYSLYVFLNPYRAALLSADQSWSGWWSGVPHELRFTLFLNSNGSPPPEWVDLPIPDDLQVGE